VTVVTFLLPILTRRQEFIFRGQTFGNKGLTPDVATGLALLTEAAYLETRLLGALATPDEAANNRLFSGVGTTRIQGNHAVRQLQVSLSSRLSFISISPATDRLCTSAASYANVKTPINGSQL
jgi:hypothetical protein